MAEQRKGPVAPLFCLSEQWYTPIYIVNMWSADHSLSLSVACSYMIEFLLEDLVWELKQNVYCCLFVWEEKGE